MDEIT
jgi:golgin subfamily A member 4